MKQLTKRQEEIVEFIKKFIATHQYSSIVMFVKIR